MFSQIQQLTSPPLPIYNQIEQHFPDSPIYIDTIVHAAIPNSRGNISAARHRQSRLYSTFRHGIRSVGSINSQLDSREYLHALPKAGDGFYQLPSVQQLTQIHSWYAFSKVPIHGSSGFRGSSGTASRGCPGIGFIFSPGFSILRSATFALKVRVERCLDALLWVDVT